MSLPRPINWMTRLDKRLPDHIWILHERYSDTVEWDDPAGTWWVQPDYYPDTELGFARAWVKLGSLLQNNPGVEKFGNCKIHLYFTDEAKEKYGWSGDDYWLNFNFKDNSWGEIPSMILSDLRVDSNTFNEITNEIQVWNTANENRFMQGRLDRANLPQSLRQT